MARDLSKLTRLIIDAALDEKDPDRRLKAGKLGLELLKLKPKRRRRSDLEVEKDKALKKVDELL